MAKVLTDSKHYTDIANAIREAGPFVDDTFKPADMAEKITNSIAYNYNTGATEGYSQGRTDGYTEGYEKGKAEGGDGDTEAAYNEGYTAGYEQGQKDSYELITITETKTLASEVSNFFMSKINEGETHVVFSLMSNDVATMATNQCTIFEYHYLEGIVATLGERILWTRIRDGKFATYRTNSSAYDLAIVAGDVYKKVVLS